MKQSDIEIVVNAVGWELYDHCAGIDHEGETVMRKTLSQGGCVKVTIPDDGGSCEVVPGYNRADDRVWFVRYGEEQVQLTRKVRADISKAMGFKQK